MIMTEWEAVERVADRVVENTKDIKQKNRQRRHQVVDMYGVEFTRQGANGSPAQFYLSISPDMVYMERFEFKLIIQPFTMYAGSGTSPATVSINNQSLDVRDRSLSVNGSAVSPNPHDHAISPNPHTHTAEPHTHNIAAGISQVPTDADDFSVVIEGIDVTPYLMAQYGRWISGQGVYPSLDIGEDYDILEVASDLMAEGREADADKLVKSGYKSVQITSSKPFQVTLVLYLKYSHMNR